MFPSITAPASRRLRRAGLGLALAASAAALGVSAQSAQAAFTLNECGGSSAVKGQGSSFQNGAQAYWKTIFEGGNRCQGNVTAPSYNGNGSGNGIAAMGGGGGNTTLNCAATSACTLVNNAFPAGQRDTTTAFAGSDEPLSEAQLNSANAGPTSATSDDGKLHTIPVALGAATIILHVPAGCSWAAATNGTTNGVSGDSDAAGTLTARPKIPSTLLEKAFAGASDADTWGDLIPGIAGTGTGIAGDTSNNGASCATIPVRRIVRNDASGTTFTVKSWLQLINPSRNWTSYANQQWPQGGNSNTGADAFLLASGSAPCPGTAQTGVGVLLCKPSATGGGGMAAAVNATDGAIGYLDLVTARGPSGGFEITPGAAQDYTFWIPVQNNAGQYIEPTDDPTAHRPNQGAKGSNCATAPVSGVPTANAANDNDPTLGLWTNAAAVGGANYPVCVLTYALAWDDNAPVYGLSAANEAIARTVKDYVGTMTSSFGQRFNGTDYSPLPASLLAIAQNGVAAIGWNKSADQNTQPPPPPPPPPPVVTTPVTPTTPTTPVVPSNKFSIPSAKASSTKLTYKVTLPGAGTLTVKATAKYKGKTITVGSLTASPKGAGTANVSINLSSAAKSALKKSSLKVTITFTFTPNGGTAASQKKTATLKKVAAKKKSTKKKK